MTEEKERKLAVFCICLLMGASVVLGIIRGVFSS